MENISVRAIIKKGNKFLLVRRRKSDFGGGLWQFAGGKAEGMKPSDALVKEIKEEINLKILNAKISHKTTHKQQYKTYYYNVKVKGKPKYQRAELSKIGFFTKKQAKKLPLTAGARKLFYKEGFA